MAWKYPLRRRQHRPVGQRARQRGEVALAAGWRQSGLVEACQALLEGADAVEAPAPRCQTGIVRTAQGGEARQQVGAVGRGILAALKDGEADGEGGQLLLGGADACAQGGAPGRVDSPPRSSTSAPAASISPTRSTTACGDGSSPPSEKESGVTLTTPMTSAGRGKRNSNWRAVKSISNPR